VTESMYFFGAHREIGHYLWRVTSDVGLVSYGIRDNPFSFPTWQLDGYRFQPGSIWPAPRVRRDPVETLGIARLTHVDGWTVVGMWDRSVDQRGASCAAIIVPGQRGLEDVVEEARRRMPETMKRFPALVAEQSR
jgi:hypothetical protein